ncbi:MAG: UDP-2,3-diacylglucosamine diphosphatase [Betaproteobacteria bacterium]|nr:UDP-2,3-diacylglucosamine diphosphatase [Betaproteobacteria bacterium]
MSATLFVSDLHLSATRPAISRLFQDFLAHQARQADQLYILGDLFEYWAGDDDLSDPFNASICAALRQLAESGTQIFFMPGNRDFLTDADFARASGLSVLTEPQVVDIAGFSTLLLHGDTLCTDDAAYQEFRNKVRSSAWQENFLAQPLAERKAQIEALRRQSNQEKQFKSAAIMDVNPAAVAAVLRSHGYPRLIHGHTHRPARHRHQVDGHTCERWVLGDWYDSGNYLHCDETGCRYLTLPAA